MFVSVELLNWVQRTGFRVALSSRDLRPDSGQGLSITKTVSNFYKSPACGCCDKWLDYPQENGFFVTVQKRRDIYALKRELAVKPQFQSCHTAVAGDYVLEEHIPAIDISRLLEEKPDIQALVTTSM